MDYQDVIRESRSIAGRVRDADVSKAFKGVNFMTRERLGYFTRGVRQIELSMGTGFSSDWCFGVTVAIADTKIDGESTCFDDLSEAIAYMDTLTDN